MTEFISKRNRAPGSVSQNASGLARPYNYADLDGTEAREVFLSLWRRKWHILACGFFLGLAMFSLAARQTKLYSAEATMILDPRVHHFVAEQSRVVEDLELSNAVVESAVAVLRSKQMMRSVVEAIGLEEFQNIHSGRRSYGLLGGLLDRAKNLMSSGSADLSLGQIPRDQRRTEHLVYALSEGTKVERLGKSYVIRLSVVTTDPEVSADVSNQLVAQYIEGQLRQRRQIAEAAVDWLSGQVAEQRTSLIKHERAIQEFQQDWLATDGRTDGVLAQQVAELNREQANVRAKLVAETARLRRLEQTYEDGGATAVADTQTSALILELRVKSNELQNEALRLAASVGDSHPDRVELETERRLIDMGISAEVAHLIDAQRAEVAMLVQQEASLARDVDALEMLRVDAARSNLELSQLEAERDIVKEAYLELSLRLTNVRSQAEIQRAEARLLTVAQIPTGPSAPRPKLIGFFGVCIGVSLGFLSVLAFEAMGPGFNSARALERATGVSVLASIPAPQWGNHSGWLPLAPDRRSRLLNDRLRLLSLKLSSKQEGGRLVLLSGIDAAVDGSEIQQALAQLLTSQSLRVCVVAPSHLAASSALQSARIGADDRKGVIDFESLDLSGESDDASLIQQKIRALKKEYDFLLVLVPNLKPVIGPWLVEVSQLILNVQYRRTDRRAFFHLLDTVADVARVPTALLLTSVPRRFDPGF